GLDRRIGFAEYEFHKSPASPPAFSRCRQRRLAAVGRASYCEIARYNKEISNLKRNVNVEIHRLTVPQNVRPRQSDQIRARHLGARVVLRDCQSGRGIPWSLNWPHIHLGNRNHRAAVADLAACDLNQSLAKAARRETR